MTTKLIQIGNSKGIRLPKSLIEQIGLSDEIEIAVGKGQIVLRPLQSPRAGWDEAFAKALRRNGEQADTEWLNTPNRFDDKEWKW
jgi:antitoxin MazE